MTTMAPASRNRTGLSLSEAQESRKLDLAWSPAARDAAAVARRLKRHIHPDVESHKVGVGMEGQSWDHTMDGRAIGATYKLDGQWHADAQNMHKSVKPHHSTHDSHLGAVTALVEHEHAIQQSKGSASSEKAKGALKEGDRVRFEDSPTNPTRTERGTIVGTERRRLAGVMQTHHWVKHDSGRGTLLHAPGTIRRDS